MNAKKMKKINRHVDTILVLWLKTLVSEEEAAKINHDNLHSLLPAQTHIRANNRYMLSAFSPKWVRKFLKRLAVKHPNRDVFSFSLTEVMKESHTWKNAK